MSWQRSPLTSACTRRGLRRAGEASLLSGRRLYPSACCARAKRGLSRGWSPVPFVPGPYTCRPGQRPKDQGLVGQDQGRTRAVQRSVRKRPARWRLIRRPVGRLFQ
jgi:hypothetical protein